MTPKQINFAAQHDWFLEDNGNGSITVTDYTTNEDGLFVMQPRTFDNFDLLLQWAGY